MRHALAWTTGSITLGKFQAVGCRAQDFFCPSKPSQTSLLAPGIVFFPFLFLSAAQICALHLSLVDRNGLVSCANWEPILCMRHVFQDKQFTNRFSAVRIRPQRLVKWRRKLNVYINHKFTLSHKMLSATKTIEISQQISGAND
ncbi:hypothetical protein THIX_60797 [Thiomonas sp. X19]|nr:hypothetical protein THIX_60797 [Thiomonas sp. X19]